MKKYILVLGLCLFVLAAKAQQTPLFSQYMTNYYLLNPAAAGAEKDIVLQTAYRTQWVGFEGAPKTYYLSGHTPLQKSARARGKGMRRGRRSPAKMSSFHAAGAFLYGDVAGPISRTGINLSYAYHIPLNREISSSVGITAGVQQFFFDANRLHLADNSNNFDPVTMAGSQKTLIPDISLGYYIYSKQFSVGLSLAQALGNKIFKYEISDMETNSKLYRHLFFSAGYNFEINKQITLAPSTLLKYTMAAPAQADLNVRGIYNFDNRRGKAPDDKVWAGLSYRTQDALVALLGGQFLERYELNYSYDYTLSALKNHSAGSHEISFGMRIARAKGRRY